MEAEPRSLDPYEQQLLKVFDSYDHDNRGSLDSEGLTQLCQTLQLEERGAELVRCLLKDPKRSRATFGEFKEALLALLGNIQNEEKGSPDREVSPKFVYGSKKYGRRSRPREDGGNERKPPTPVQRSSSQSDVSHSKKRKTNYKLKRCTSFPGNSSFTMADDDSVCSEETLRDAWNRLGVGKDGYLNQTELVLVCESIGLHRLARGAIRRLSDKLHLDFERGISFQELLDILQHEDSWFDSTPPESNISYDFGQSNISLGPDGNGVVSAELITDMWECAGITSPKLLLSDLGFKSQQIDVGELAGVLDKEIKGVADTLDYSNSHVVLFQASLSLHQSEIRCLKGILEQMCAEREKLKCDVAEANNRATLLAQEVDDNHARMERNTQKQVKFLEQRHADLLKDINEQFANEREQATLLNCSLEQKIACLETEEMKLRNELASARHYATTLEKDNQSLNDRIHELQRTKQALTAQVGTLEADKQKYMEIEQIEPLLAKLSALQAENSQLRDRNDEMASEVERLGDRINAMRVKMSSTPTFDVQAEESVSIVCEGVGTGSKRRNDGSPSKDIGLLGLGEGSPRLGKVRKFQQNQDLLDVPFTSSESGFDTEIDCFESSLSISGTEAEEIARLQAKVNLLEHLLQQHSIPIPSGSHQLECDDTTTQFKKLSDHCSKLEVLLSEVKTDIGKILTKTSDNSYEVLNKLNDKLEKVTCEKKSKAKTFSDVSTETDFEEISTKDEEEKNELTAKCAELENCIELLKNEYEKCEDYWASKLEEERQMFDQEQVQYVEKVNELIAKVAEYEEQVALQDSRLPPIEEKDLEKQFTDLEQEFDEYRATTQFQLDEKEKEIELLKQLLENTSINRQTATVSVQAELNIEQNLDQKMSNLSNHMVESTNFFSADAMPFGWTTSRMESESQDRPETSQNQQNNVNSTWDINSKAEVAAPQWENPISTPSRPKRTRKFDRHSLLYKKTNHERESTKYAENVMEGSQLCTVPVSTIHSLSGRLHHVEQRCRHLQTVLKQQHYYAEQTLQHCWQQHRGEKAELQFLLKSSQDKLEQQIKICNHQLEQLARTDMLVKDLYVENSYLVANVQRLEQQCHLLAQSSSNSCSV